MFLQQKKDKAMDKICEKVCKHTLEAIYAVSGYTLDDLSSSDRREPLVFYRQIFCKICADAGVDHEEVAKMINRHRSTVYSSIALFKVGRKYNVELYRLWDKVHKKLGRYDRSV